MNNGPSQSLPGLRALRWIDALEAGLVAWWCDANGRVLTRPQIPGDAGRLFGSDEFAAIIEQGCSGASPGTPFVPRKIIPGTLLFSMRPPAGTQKTGFAACLGLTPGALNSEEMSRLISQCGLTSAPAHEALRPFAMHAEESLLSIVRMLEAIEKHRHHQMLEHECVVEQFSRELADTYEHVSALFSIARASSRIADPPAVVRLACEQISRILRFRWVMTVFSDRSRADTLRDQHLVAGAATFDIEELSAAMRGWLKGNPPDTWTCVVDPGDHPFATIAGCEVAVEPITDETGTIGLICTGGKFGVDPDISSIDIQLIDAVADLLGVFHQNVTRHEAQRAMFVGVVRSLTSSIDAKDPYTRGHSERVALVGRKIAEAIKLEPAAVERVYFAGLLHDVGKIGVPEDVLRKPGKLTDEEFEHIKRHPTIGHQILQDIPDLDDILPAVLHHHERWDGRGYPHNLEQKQAPLIARIIGVADAFDAMSSNRAYRSALSRETVLAEIRNCAGAQFDPELAEAFLTIDLASFDEALDVERRKAA